MAMEDNAEINNPPQTALAMPVQSLSDFSTPKSPDIRVPPARHSYFDVDPAVTTTTSILNIAQICSATLDCTGHERR